MDAPQLRPPRRPSHPARARVRRRTRRRLAACISGGLLAAGLVALGPVSTPARAVVNNVIPANSGGDPIDEIRADDPLFAYASVDIVGGKICVVNGNVTDPEGASCESPAWGRPNFVSGIGTQFLPIEGKLLHTGTWRLLGDSPTGNSLSQPFTVLPCEFACRPVLSDPILVAMKASAAEIADIHSDVCLALDVKDAVGSAPDLKAGYYSIVDALGLVKRTTRLRTVVRQVGPTIVSSGFSLIGIAAPSYLETNDLALALLRQVYCRTIAMYEDIEKDPPNASYQQVVNPILVDQPEPGGVSLGAGRLADVVSDQYGLGVALLAAVERYQGALGAGSSDYQHAQAVAIADHGRKLVDAQWESVRLLRAYAARAADDPVLSGPVVDDLESRQSLAALFARVRSEGLVPEEIADLRDQGLTDAEIAQVPAGFALDPATIPVGMSFPALLIAAADELEAAIPAFDQIAREAEGVATSVNEAPQAGFNCLQSSSLTMRCESTYIPGDLDELTYTWDLGDGSTATGRTVDHTYQDASTRTVQLTVSDRFRENTSTTSIGFVNCCAPIVGFDIRPVTVRVGEPVQLFDASEDDGSAVSWQWSVSGEPDRTDQDPTFTFDTPGRRFVQLSVTDDDGRHGVGQGVVWVLPDSLPEAPGCSSPADATLDSVGNEFLFTFPQSDNGNTAGPYVSIHVSAEEATSGIVEIPGIDFHESFAVEAGASTRISLPSTRVSDIVASGAIMDVVDHVVPAAVRVCADGPVSVTGMNRSVASTDAFLALPTDALGTSYVVSAYEENVSAVTTIPQPSNLAIVGVEDGTEVTITPSAPTLSGGQLNHSDGPAKLTPSRPAGQPFTVELDRWGVYYLESGLLGGDLTGTQINATLPVAVFGGSQCSYVPRVHAACDHLVEQLPPTNTWGDEFVFPSLATRTAGDLVRIVSRDDATVVTVDGREPFRLDAGGHRDVILASGSSAHVTATAPILVTQLALGSGSDGIAGNYADPFQATVVPLAQFRRSYVVNTPAPAGGRADEIGHWLGLTAPAGATCSLDGAAVTDWEPSAPGWRVSRASVATGSHRLECGGARFGVQSYGFGWFESYGFPGGLELGPIAPAPKRLETLVTYSGSGQVQYSDELTPEGSLFEASPGVFRPIARETLELRVGQQGGWVTAGPTGPAGRAVGPPVAVLAIPGPVSVESRFLGSGAFAPSDARTAVTVTKEDCTLEYDGDEAGATPLLAAQFGEPDRSLGDLAGKNVSFAVDGVDVGSAPTGAAGRASLISALGPGSHEVVVRFAGDDYYTPCAANPVTVTVGDVTTPARVVVTKTENATSPVHEYTFRLTGGPDGIALRATTNVDDSPIGSGVLSFNALTPGSGYLLCELAVPAGTSTTLSSLPGATTDAATGDTCAPLPLASGELRNISVDNVHPSAGGRRSKGYWSNWNTCAKVGGNVVDRARRTGNRLVDEFLPVSLSTAITVTTCTKAVEVLSTSSATAAEHALAAQLLAALLNRTAGSGACAAAQDEIAVGRSLLAAISWNGSPTSKVVTSKHRLRSQFLTTAQKLAAYNTGGLCP